MAKDFPVDFRIDDLTGSWETLQNYRMQESLIDDETSDFVYGYIKNGIKFYETRIEQIKAQLEWFSFMDSETSPKETRDYGKLQPLDRKVFIKQQIADREIGYGDSWFSCQIPYLKNLYNYYEFMEADH